MGNKKRIKVIEVDRYRDGGTVVYEDAQKRKYYLWYPTSKVYDQHPRCAIGSNTPSSDVCELDIELEIVKNFSDESEKLKVPSGGKCLTPTMRLRWNPEGDRNKAAVLKGYSRQTKTCFGILHKGHYETSNEFFVLQQWWQEMDAATGEWRDIEIDWSYTNDPPN